MNAVEEFDQVIASLGRISHLAQLRDKVKAAYRAGQGRCGDCFYWMKSSQCPLEKNVNGMSRGPSGDALPCGKFCRTQRSIDNQKRLIDEAIDFAKQHDLPVPDHLTAAP